MPSVPSLQRIEIRSQVQRLDDCVAQLAMQSFVQVRRLCLDVPTPLLQTMLRHIHHLRSLEELALLDELNTDVDPAALDFSQLALLPQLWRVFIKYPNETGNNQRWSLTSAQVAQLVVCRGLTELFAGQWSLTAAIGQPTYAQQVDEHLGQLVRGVLARPALAAAEGHEPAPLRFLDLSTSMMTPAVWRHVSQLTNQTELNAYWSSQLMIADWNKLSGFRQLQRLVISLHDTSLQPPPRQAILTALPPSVSELQVTYHQPSAPWRIGREIVDGIVHSLPQMKSLAIGNVHFDILRWDALAALSRATQLDRLTLKGCAPTKAEARALRVALPSLAKLSQLEITDVEDARLSAAEAEPLTAELLQRCPMLTRAAFTQSLLESDSDADKSDESEQEQAESDGEAASDDDAQSDED